jgi:hypothetical protein
MIITKIDRRNFLRTTLLGAVATTILPNLPLQLLAAEKSEPLPAGSTAVPESDAVATAIGYKADTTKIDFKKYPKRQDPQAKGQHCNNCALYTPVNKSWGKCQMLTSGLVNASGWCGSWSKKA